MTEPPGEKSGRGCGGRHVELVGYRENVFCWLPQVDFYPTWEECLADFEPVPWAGMET